jgi:predicted dehydrogenase
MLKNKLNVAIIGLGFGTQFIPIYQRHPCVNMYAICRRSQKELNEIGDIFGVDKRYNNYKDVLDDPIVDFVHINTPIPDHGSMSIAGLKAGKHVMCAVPMAISVEDCRKIVTLVQKTGLKYMMAETVIYSREFFFVRELYQKGELGRIQFIQATHHQDMENWPHYWLGLPPMYYATHCVSPCLALTYAEAEYVSCLGSGKIQEELILKYNSPFALETAHFKFRNSDISARIYRSLFDTARQYRESFDVYGSKKSFEWPLIKGEDPIMHTAKKPEAKVAKRVKVPDYANLLPKEIQPFTTKMFFELEEYEHIAVAAGADPDGTHNHLINDPGSLEGHGGSHPHLVNEFVSSIIEDRDPFPNAVQSANYTCVGILAHKSATKGGERIYLPKFTFLSK